MERHERHERDLRLVRDVLRGDPAARAEFAGRMACVPRLILARNRRIGSPLDRDEMLDLIQDVQLAIWRKLDTFAGRAALETWAFRFCHLGLLKFLERRERRDGRRRLLSDEVLSRPDEAAPREPSGEGERLERLLRHLSRREREVTRLRFLERLEFAEIAQALEISVSSAKTHCYRALDKLRGLVGAGAGREAE